MSDPWKKYGGPAFPTNDGGDTFYKGMSQRDYFACQFMSAIIASGSSISIADDDIALQQVKVAYAIADTMLKVRGE